MKFGKIKKLALENILKRLLIVVSVLILLSCAGEQRADHHSGSHNTDQAIKSEDIFFDSVCNTPYSRGSLFFYGFSPHYTDIEKEKDAILESAFESVMLFHDIDVSYFGFYLESGAAFQGISKKLFIETEILDKENIKEKLKLRYNFRNRNISGALFEMEQNDLTNTVPDDFYNFTGIEISVREKKPSWINLVPEIRDYNFSVGVSERYSRISESIRHADLNSIEEMIKQKSVSVVSKTDKGYYGRNATEHSAAVIKGFYIIRRWWDPDMRNYYSLGVSSAE